MLAHNLESNSATKPSGAGANRSVLESLFKGALSRHFSRLIPVAAARLGWAMAGEKWEGFLMETDQQYLKLMAQTRRLELFARRRGLGGAFSSFRDERAMLDAINQTPAPTSTSLVDADRPVLQPQPLDGPIRLRPGQLTSDVQELARRWPGSMFIESTE